MRVVGRRISLFNILKAHEELGESPETIAKNYDLSSEHVGEVITFAREHRSEVDPYMADYRAELERQYAEYTSTPAALRIRRLVEERLARRVRLDS